MGIPLYFRYIAKNYPSIILDIIKNNGVINETIASRLEAVRNIHHLYLDMNCLIHPACRSVLSNPSNIKCSRAEIETKMLKSVRNYLERVILFVKPKELIYLSIDGPAPKAKMVQQRLRRYRSVMERKEIQEIKKRCKIANETYDWDTNAITPGTPFMEALSIDLEKFIKSSSLFDGLQIIFSNSNVPGEGEHKIFNYIKHNIRHNLERNMCIYGLDADLIMLSMASQQSNIFLLREAVHFGKVDIDHLLFLDIDYLKKYLLEHIKREGFEEGGPLNYILDQEIINDYCFICFLLGNDFLPHLLNLSIDKDHIDYMLNTYYEILLEEGSTLLNVRDNCVNLSFFRNFLEALCREEDHELEVKITSYYSKRMYTRGKTDYEQKISLHENWPLSIRNKKRDPVRLDKPDWKLRYYPHKFNIHYGDKVGIGEICNSYYKTIIWVYQYYFKTHCPSWDWAYPYLDPPAISDLVEHFKYDMNSIEYKASSPVNPLEQLLIVLPPESRDLLPKSYGNLMVDPKSPIIEYYPTKVKLDSLYKWKYYQCEPILPLLDISHIKKISAGISLNDTDTHRNRLDKPIIVNRE